MLCPLCLSQVIKHVQHGIICFLICHNYLFFVYVTVLYNVPEEGFEPPAFHSAGFTVRCPSTNLSRSGYCGEGEIATHTPISRLLTVFRTVALAC